MNNTQEALLAIALSQSKILEISYLVEAGISTDWKEGQVIRRPDGTFLRWQPSSERNKDGLQENGSFENVKSKDINYGNNARTSESILSDAIKKQTEEAEKTILEVSEKINSYKKVMEITKDPIAKKKLEKELNQAIKDVSYRLVSDKGYIESLEKQVREDAEQEKIVEFKQKINTFTNSLDRMVGGDRIRQAPGNIAKSALEEGKAGADALASPQGRIAAATAGTVAAGVLVAALNRRKALNLITKQVEKAAAKVATREAAKEAGAIVKDVGPIAKTLAKAEDSVPVVGAMIRSHRKEKAIAVSREATKEARETAEKALSTMQENDFDKAWDDLDDVFTDVSDSIAKPGVVDTLANIVSKPYSEMKNLKLQSRGSNATSDAIMTVALNTAGLGDDSFSDEMMELLKSAGFKLSAEDIEAASETLNNSVLMKRISSELINSMCKH